MNVDVHCQSPPRRSRSDKVDLVARLSPGARPKQRPLPPGTNPFKPDPSLPVPTKAPSQDSAGLPSPHQWSPNKPNDAIEVLEDSSPPYRRRIPSDSMVTLIESTYPDESLMIHQQSSTDASNEPFAKVFADQDPVPSQGKFIVADKGSPTKNQDLAGKEKLVGFSLFI